MRDGTPEVTPMASDTPRAVFDNPNFDVDHWKTGVDFVAVGADPSWSIDLDFDGTFRFAVAGAPPVEVPAGKGMRAQDADVMRYRTVTEGSEIIVTLMAGECSSESSSLALTHRVRVDFKLPDARDYTSYQGCGRYVIDPRLNDIWALRAVGGQAVDIATLRKGAPVLEFHLRDWRVLGHTGCNSLQGRFAVVGPQILRFGPLTTTRMACPNPALEQTLLTTLSDRQLEYTLNKGRLELRRPGHDALRFQKVD